MATKKKIAPRASRTKAETQEALEELGEQIANRGYTELSTVEQQRQDERNKQIRTSTAGMTAESVAQKLTTVGLEATKSLAAVSEQLVEQVRQLDEARAAVALEKAELEELYGKDVVASSTAELLADYAKKKKQLDDDYAAAQAQESQKFSSMSESYRKQIAELEVQHKETIQALAKERARETAEYNYRRDNERARENDKYSFELLQRNNAEKLRTEELNRGWAQREAKLAAQEAEYNAALTRIAGLPKEIEEATLAAVAEASKSLATSKHFEVSALKKEAEANEKLARFEIENLKSANSELKTTIAKLSADLAAANEKVKGIAEKALESASSQRTLAEMSVMTQNRQDNGVSRKS